MSLRPVAGTMIDASLAPERRDTVRYLLILLPATVVLLALFVYPLLGLVDRSVYKRGAGYTLEFYGQIWRVPVYLQVIGRTFRISALVTLMCLALGYPVAYLLAMLRPRLARLLMIVVVLPFFTSIIVRTFSWMVLLGEHGLVNESLLAAGLIQLGIPTLRPLLLLQFLLLSVFLAVSVVAGSAAVTLFPELRWR